MLVGAGRVWDLLPGEDRAELGAHVVHWRGLVYLPGHPPGAPSLRACDWDGRGAVCGAAAALKGSFAVTVTERAGGRQWCFTSAAGTLDAFVGGGMVATSFLQLCAVLGVRAHDLDPDAVAEFVDLGFVHGPRTPVAAIRRLGPGRVVELAPGAALAEHDTGVPGITVPPPPELSIEGLFAALSASLRGLRVSVDLTGGADSRLVASLLAGDLDVECAVTGVAGNRDIELATDTARALSRPLHVLEHSVANLDDDIAALFEASDGLCDLLTFHRLRQNALARRSRGVQVALSGVGGELYKDFWWLQDLPRYRRRHSNVERLFDLRFRPLAVPDGVLAGDVAAAARGVRERMLHDMRALTMPLNTQTYDRVYLEIKMRTAAARITSMNSLYLPFHPPLLDPELVRLGYALPRRRRFFNGFHRGVVSAAAPAAARLPTTEGGMSLSVAHRHQAADTALYARDRARRLGAKTRQRVRGTPLGVESPDNPELIGAARAAAAFPAAVERLSDLGVLGTAAPPDRYVGRILSLGLLVERLER